MIFPSHMTLMTQVQEMISKGGNTFGSINNGSEELHGNSQTGTAWSFETVFSSCSVSLMLIWWHISLLKKGWRMHKSQATWTAA